MDFEEKKESAYEEWKMCLGAHDPCEISNYKGFCSGFTAGFNEAKLNNDRLQTQNEAYRDHVKSLELVIENQKEIRRRNLKT